MSIELSQSEKHASLAAERRDTVAWCALCGLLLLAALAGPFFAGRVYTADDLGGFHLPIRAFYADQLRRGESADWMPQLFSGFYLAGEGQAGMYHPLHQLLYRVFPLHAALGWEFLLPYPAMMIGMWLLLRRRLGRSDAAAFGGLLFAFCSFNLLHFVHPNAIAIVAHIPWLLWAIDIVLVESRPWRVAGASTLIALLTGSQLLLGYPQYVWYSLIAEFSFVLFVETAHRYAPRIGCSDCATCDDCVGCSGERWPRVLIAKGVGLAIGGAQLLPTLDAWLHSARQTVDSDFVFWGSLHPLNVFQLVAPYMYADRVVGGNTHEFGLYVGAVPLALVLWTVARRSELGAMAHGAWTSIGFALFMLLLAFGQYGFVYPITTWLPLVGGFRFPCRYLVLFQLSMIVAATIGFLLVLREHEHARRLSQKRHWKLQHKWQALWRDFEPLWALLAISAAVAIVGLVLSKRDYIAPLPGILAGPLLFAAAIGLVIGAVRGHRAAVIGLMILAACDLGYYGLSYSVYPRNQRLETYLASTATPPDDADGRVVGALYRVDEPGRRTGDQMTMLGWSRADGYAGLEPRRKLDYRLLPSLRVAGVRWVKRDPSTSVIAGLNPYDNGWLEVPTPLPRVRLVTKTKTSSDPAADIATICPDTTALCEVPIGLPASEPGKAMLVAERPGRLEIEVNCPTQQLLVIAESYHRDWLASIDAQPHPVFRINGDFMGCIVDAGHHRLDMVFRPTSLKRGWNTSFLGLAMLSFCFIGTLRRPKPVWLEETPQ